MIILHLKQGMITQMKSTEAEKNKKKDSFDLDHNIPGSSLREELALNLNYYAKEYGITQADICRETGIVSSTMASYFTGKRFPRPDQLEAIAKCFNIPVYQLFGSSDPDQDLIKDLPYEIRIIAWGGRKLKKKDRESLLKYCRFMYPGVFDEEDT